MASRTYAGDIRSLDRAVVKLYGTFIGAGAADVTGVNCLGFTIARTGVGLFTITLEDRYPAGEDGTAPLLFLCSSRDAASAAATGEMQVIVDSSAAAAKTITTRWAEAGAAADVASGDRVRLELTLRNTSTPRNGA